MGQHFPVHVLFPDLDQVKHESTLDNQEMFQLKKQL